MKKVFSFSLLALVCLISTASCVEDGSDEYPMKKSLHSAVSGENTNRDMMMNDYVLIK
jgi:hypothetical protein